MYIALAVAVLSALLIGTSGRELSSSISAGHVYWNNVLPKTSMPKAIKDLLPGKVLRTTNNHQWNRYSAANEGDLTSNYGGTPTTVLPPTHINEGDTTSNYQMDIGKVLRTTNNHQWNRYSAANEGDVTSNYGGTPTTVLPPTHINEGDATSNYQKDIGDEKPKYDPTITMFFFVEDLRPGTKMRLTFHDTSVHGITFISNTQSNSIPFSSSKLPDILTSLSINPDSVIVSSMKKTLASCEDKPMEGETKHCATSLESMVDFTTSVLKTNNLISISTTTDKENMSKQEYEITSSYIKSSGDNTVVCHARTYAYAVFYCHKLKRMDVFEVEMVGADKTKVKAVAICHRDTSKWNPKNLALRILNVSPGTVPVCHFLPQYDVLWTASY